MQFNFSRIQLLPDQQTVHHTVATLHDNFRVIPTFDHNTKYILEQTSVPVFYRGIKYG